MSSTPSEEESLRQYAYMRLCRERIRDMQEKDGRMRTYFIQTFGCQMNARDSEKLAGILTEIGYVPAEDEREADFVLYNTCTVRENANQRVYGRLGALKGYKAAHPGMLIALCGCMMQEPEVVRRIRQSYRHVDLIFGTHNIYQLAELLWQRLNSDGMVMDIREDADRIVEDLPDLRKYRFKAGVNIMFGCNNFCSYCIVPYVRGRERSRQPEDILDEIRRDAADGVKEIMLLGQNVNSYGKNLPGSTVTFADLLRKAAQIDGIERIRFMTSHPKDLSDALIEAMASSERICRHMHLPLQSGSDAILARMNRHYTRADYLRLVEKLRAAIPDIAITTDIIVGFPGETEADFEDTLTVVEQARFDSAFTFIYSKRTGTPAAVMPDQVPEDVIKNRFDRLLERINVISREVVARDTGRVMPVLVEEINHQDPALVTGRLSNNTLVHFPGDAAMIGRIIPVRLDTCHGFYFTGSIPERN